MRGKLRTGPHLMRTCANKFLLNEMKRLRQNVNGWKSIDGQVDAAYGMTVTKRNNGEYVILFENAAWANTQIYRWCPSGKCPKPKP